MDEKDDADTSWPYGSLRPAIRARLLRRLVRRQHQGRAQPRARAHRPASPSPTSSTAAPPAPSPTPATAPGSSSRSPTASCAASSGTRASTCRRPAPTPSAWRSCPPTTSPPRRPRRRSRPSSPTRASPSSRWRDVPVDPSCLGATSRAAMPSVPPAASSPTRPAPPASTSTARRSSPASASSTSWTPSSPPTSRRCRRARSSTRGCSRRRSCRRSSPTSSTSASRAPCCSCTAASRPTRSRRGRSPTRTATSPTTARSTRCRATRTGCAPARRCSTARRCPGIERAFPICTPGASDTARFDEVLELLHLGGRPLHHAVLMMIPEAWENNDEMDPAQRAFYRFHSSVMEPWDGPASVTFTDGTVIGAVLDRNGLRPSRYWVTDDDLVVMASEVGVIDIDPAKVVTKGRLQPGRMFLIDTAQGRIVDDEEIKTTLAAEHPYAEWLEREPRRARRPARARARRVQPRQRAAPPAAVRLHPRGAQGHPRPDGARRAPSRSARWAPTRRSPCCRTGRGCCSTTSPSSSPRSPTRRSTPSARRSSRRCRRRSARRRTCCARARRAAASSSCRSRSSTTTSWPRSSTPTTTARFPGLRSHVVKGLYRVAGGGLALERALSAICGEVSTAIDDGARIIVLSDRNADAVEAPIPSLLLTAAVHHHLVRTKQRTMVGLLVECGDAREVHHMALLDRLRRRRDQPVPGVRVDRGPHRRGPPRPRRRSTRTRPCATTSRRAARACSR